MHNANYFAKFDIREAYLHVVTSDKTAELLTITTPKGLYKVKRLMYGIINAPAIWQRIMDNLFEDIPGICVFYDDVKVIAGSETELVARIKKFFEICQETGIRLNKDKCEIDCSNITYLGYRIDKEGLHKMDDKINAIRKANQLQNIE